MTSTLEINSSVHIRPIEQKDFAFIQSLASKFPEFTVPPDYILWFFVRFHSDYCRIIEEEAKGSIAYLLAMQTSDPKNGIAVWQVGSKPRRYLFVFQSFAIYLCNLALRTGATSISFTAVPTERSVRIIRSLAKRLFHTDMVQLGPVPTKQNEFEFRLPLTSSGGCSSGDAHAKS